MTVQDIQRLFEYTKWANKLVLDAAEALTDEQLRRDVKISNGSIFGTLVHMGGAEAVWLERWRKVPPTPFWKDADFADLAALRARWAEIEADRDAYLATLTDEDLQRDLTFTRLNGEVNTMQLGGQLQHVVNHATLHRGQVVGMIRQLGIVPPSTDLLFYLRSR